MKILMPEYNTLTKGDIDMSVFESFGDLVIMDQASREELKAEIRDADVLFVNKTKVDEELLACAEKLRYIGECATGFNNIDLEACKKRGIRVTNVPTYSTSSVAQQTFAYILEYYNKVAAFSDFCMDGGWVSSPYFSNFKYDMFELEGVTIGLIGYGLIAQSVAKIANAFGMNVLAYKRSAAVGTTSEDGLAHFVSLDDLVGSADIVSVHCPLNDQSQGMCDSSFFARMKDGAMFINTARGPIVDELALKEALESGKLGFAALDVLEVEPMSPSCPLLGVKNLIITPHVAWAPFETRTRLVEIVADNYKSFAAGEPKNVIA